MWYIQVLIFPLFFESLYGQIKISPQYQNNSVQSDRDLYPRSNNFVNDINDEGTSQKYINDNDEIRDEQENIFLSHLFQKMTPKLIKVYYLDNNNENQHEKIQLSKFFPKWGKKKKKIPAERSEMFKDGKVNLITDEINLNKDDDRNELENHATLINTGKGLRPTKKVKNPNKKRRRHNITSVSVKSGRRNSGSRCLDDESTHIYNQFRINQLRSKLYGNTYALSEKLKLEKKLDESLRKIKINTSEKKGSTRIKTKTKFRFSIG